ncbi:MAG: YdbL family protein [Deltaproteobacteria bacterium]|nr:YdbL family protein [Deltaproteobacteria bacterium]MBW2069106.1 YdbL family protein [Deltaproteobacteria bacterium]
MGWRAKGVKLEVLFTSLVLLLISCVTINIYFPAEEVRKTAEEIVGEVRGAPENNKTDEKHIKEPQSFRFLPGKSSLFVSIAYAQREVNVSNAAIRAIKERMKKRLPMLKPYFNSGNIGEGSDGYLHVRSFIGLDFKAKARLKKLVKAENDDRRALYREIARALKIDSSQIGRVASIFAQEWQKSAPSGWWIEIKPGKWIRK